ncbi:hypothetical protein [Paenibacillus eucommiae]|uniref:Uncharacterized protein n=1 Tax=Paenibacillus eucommiae TaxID=1355755 RepID=A0ABS4J3A1_9BACL|nr:hypothetical protein [Paenibacillus eucommiae]MBP1994326.1 hypothetical protein [Paenibacillus eucommiae]
MNKYERRVNDALIDPLKIDSFGMTSAYTDNFIEASPSGVQVFQNNEQYAAALVPAFEGQRRIGNPKATVKQPRNVAYFLFEYFKVSL